MEDETERSREARAAREEEVASSVMGADTTIHDGANPGGAIETPVLGSVTRGVDTSSNQRGGSTVTYGGVDAGVDSETRPMSSNQRNEARRTNEPSNDSAPNVTREVDPKRSVASVQGSTSRPLSERDAASKDALLGKVEHAMPLFKLEIMGLSTLYIMLAVMWFLGVFNLIIQIILLGAFAPAEDPALGTYSGLFEGIFAVEGILRTIAALVGILLLISYPQRVIIHWIHTYQPRQEKWFPYWNQGLIVLIIVLMAITPCYSLYQAIVFWMSFDLRDGVVDVSKQDGTSFHISLGVLSLLFSFSPAAVGYNALTSMIVLAMTFVFFGGVYHFQFQSAKAAMSATLNTLGKQNHPGVELMKQPAEEKASEEAIGEEQEEEKKGFFQRRKRRASTDSSEELLLAEDEDDEEEARANRQMINTAAYKHEIHAFEAKTFFQRAFHKTERAVKRCISRYQKHTGQLPLNFQFLAIAYLVLLLGFSISLSMNPSTVPLVSVVTVIRVCSTPTKDLLSQNSTITYQNVSMPDGSGNIVIVNATINYTVVSPIHDNELGPCSPSQSDRLIFLRALAACLFAFVELCLFYLIHRLERKTKLFLAESSYAQTRREILGFQFFLNIARFCWTVMMLGGLLSAAVNPLESYMIESGSLDFNNATNVFDVTINLDPMFQLGVGVGTIGFGSFFSMLVVWIALLAFAYLPYDSVGVKGWFVGKTMRKGEETLTATLQRDDYLLLVTREYEVAELLQIRRREMETAMARGKLPLPSSSRDRMHRSKSSWLMYAIHHGREDDEEQMRRKWLMMQVRANIFVLETEILLFHFMHLSYVLANRKLDPTTGHRVLLSWEEKEAMVEDSRFTLVEHIIDAETDTHVMVFSSEDRVVIAFRGSVSLTNWQTDFNSAEVVCEYLKDVQPDLGDVPHAMLQRARTVATKPPMVHGGFVKAYETVREHLRVVCERLLFDDIEDHPSGVRRDHRVLFVTGHSLGGGLAVLCAADLAVQLKLDHGRVAATTWGAPKVGTYSFMARFNRVVRSARRFCMADDLITRLPMDPVLQPLTLKGWWHCGTEILLNDVGNLLIRPTPLERFMFSRAIGTPQAHRRMTYATSLMVWAIRSDPDYTPDWWVSVVTLFYKNAHKRLRPVPKNIRDRLLDSLLRSGVTYFYGTRMVRDITIDTAEQEDRATEMVRELLVNLRLAKKEEFRNGLNMLINLYDQGVLFTTALEEEKLVQDEQVVDKKRTQSKADLVETVEQVADEQEEQEAVETQVTAQKLLETPSKPDDTVV